MMRDFVQNNWRIDKRIPIAVVITLFLQIAAALVWATQLNARVDSLEGKAVSSADFGEKLARIEERLQGVKQDMDYIKHAVERVGNRFAK